MPRPEQGVVTRKTMAARRAAQACGQPKVRPGGGVGTSRRRPSSLSPSGGARPLRLRAATSRCAFASRKSSSARPVDADAERPNELDHLGRAVSISASQNPNPLLSLQILMFQPRQCPEAEREGEAGATGSTRSRKSSSILLQLDIKLSFLMSTTMLEEGIQEYTLKMLDEMPTEVAAIRNNILQQNSVGEGHSKARCLMKSLHGT